MNAEERYILKIKIAKMFYLDNMTQTDIGEQLSVSRPTIIKLLNEAREEGIVKIEICDIRNQFTLESMRRDLKDLLQLRDVVVVSVEDSNRIFKELGKRAAEYLMECVCSNINVGIGWGKTLEEVAKNVVEMKHIREVTLMPLMGGPVSSNDFSRLSNNLCERIASKFDNGKVDYLYAPLFTKDEKSRETYIQSGGIKNVLEKMEDIQLALVGIGGDLKNSVTYDVAGDYEDFAFRLVEKGTVGNICGRFYDLDGNLCTEGVEGRTIAVTAQQLRAIPTVIAVGGGEHKIRSIIGGARQKLFNVLIVDNKTANSIIEYFK
ncbi:sugar-binding domain-containing protein [Petroclostridium sp. X23]|uniref:sugar-binding transcriptional regulator n=1 Tax=Petroclostridium sp. X23 TaxID=3045146 RepID=UPI0024AE4598|nr:sugar-binding domain-containing protein [Petroclostridium sp. X23]WHH57032.1 sugar-binding domain-containing protein [Petroclostridium sp. X23]